MPLLRRASHRESGTAWSHRQDPLRRTSCAPQRSTRSLHKGQAFRLIRQMWKRRLGELDRLAQAPISIFVIYYYSFLNNNGIPNIKALDTK